MAKPGWTHWGARNRMSHTYDGKDFQDVVEEIRATYFDLFDALHGMAVARAETSP
jgi:hypothetical protein